MDEDDETVGADNAPEDATAFEGQPVPAGGTRRPSLIAALRVLEAEMGIPAELLTGRGRSRILSWQRCLFASFAVSWLGHPVKEVADVSGKAGGSVSRWVSDGLELQLSAPSVRAGLEQMRAALLAAPAEAGRDGEGGGGAALRPLWYAAPGS